MIRSPLLYPLSYGRTVNCSLIITDLRDGIFSFSTPPSTQQTSSSPLPLQASRDRRLSRRRGFLVVIYDSVFAVFLLDLLITSTPAVSSGQATPGSADHHVWDPTANQHPGKP